MDTPPPAVKSKRRWLVFSVRGLLILVLGIAVLLGWEVHRARQQREAAEAVKKFGGFVHYNWEFVDGPVVVANGNFLWKASWGTLSPGRKPWAPNWLRRAVGDEHFQRMAHVSLFVDINKGYADATFYNKGPADEALEKLASQSSVRTLQVGGQQVTDKNLVHVGQMTGLEELIIFPGFGITDAGVAHLAGLKNLRILMLTNSDATDAGLRSLVGLTNLEILTFEGKGITEQGVEGLRGLKKLKTLTIGGAKISPEARKKLGQSLPGVKLEFW